MIPTISAGTTGERARFAALVTIGRQFSCAEAQVGTFLAGTPERPTADAFGFAFLGMLRQGVNFTDALRRANRAIAFAAEYNPEKTATEIGIEAARSIVGVSEELAIEITHVMQPGVTTTDLLAALNASITVQ